MFMMYLTYGAKPFLRSRQLCSHSKTSQHFMKPEGPLPCSQKPSTGPYPGARLILSIPSHPISLRSILILSTHLRLGLPCPSHPPWLDHSNYVWRCVQVMELLIMLSERKKMETRPLTCLFRQTVRCYCAGCDACQRRAVKGEVKLLVTAGQRFPKSFGVSLPWCE
jgi:hypothetical protein